MSIDFSAPWHRVSFDRLIQENLPRLLAERLPLGGYHAEPAGNRTWRARVVLCPPGGDVELNFEGLPQPDEEGVFEVDGQLCVVPPVAAAEDLATAEVRCVGEQLYDFIAAQLASAPEDTAWEASLARVLLPLDAWAGEFLEVAATPMAVADTNWLARCGLLRRVWVPDRDRVITPGHKGRVCLFETPEGPNVGRVLVVALGATIRNGRLEIVKEGPEAALGVTASMVPLLEHDDGNRALMGMNMMRQWLEQEDPEPALVQTGNEPKEPAFWCGRNLLTAFVTWDGYAHEDAVVISESCAARFRLAHPLAVGDKLSNRHGAKGVVSRILPDERMPRMEDGTPVELVYSLCGIPSRMNFGQVREAALGRVARKEGKPVVVPPFQAPDDAALKARLKEVGLSGDGMEALSLEGEKMARRSTAGWVYWGCTDHLARNKIHFSVTPDGPCQRQGEMEGSALLQAGAYELVREWFLTCSTAREGAAELAQAVAKGEVEPAGPPAPGFVDLARRLGAAGIRMELENEEVSFGFGEPEGERLELAQAVPHPWLRTQALSAVGKVEGVDGYGAVAEANERLARLLKSGAPESLMGRSRERLEACLEAYLEGLLIPRHLQLGGFPGRVLFSGRTVIAPGPDLQTDQLGLPEEMCWGLFGPRLIREVGEEGVRKQSKKAREALEALMAASRVVLNRAPSLSATALIAFHPVLCDGQAIRLHPLACEFLNADFDGDQAAVFLPVTAAAQKEAGERLSMAAHLTRDPDLAQRVCPGKDDLFGLASLSLSEEGRREIEKILGTEVTLERGIVTKRTVAKALRQALDREGAGRALEVSEGLMRLGFEAARRTGASVGPFAGETLERPPMPEGEDPDEWEAYREEMCHALEAQVSFDDPDAGAVVLLSRCGARGNLGQLAQLTGPGLGVTDVNGRFVPMRHGWREGHTPEEMFARSYSHLNGLFEMHGQMAHIGREVRRRNTSAEYAVLSRAARAEKPGMVFARAALSGEVDPLADVRSRLFVGLPAS